MIRMSQRTAQSLDGSMARVMEDGTLLYSRPGRNCFIGRATRNGKAGREDLLLVGEATHWADGTLLGPEDRKRMEADLRAAYQAWGVVLVMR